MKKAGKRIVIVAGKVEKALNAKEKRIWGGYHWMNDEDKKMADMCWEERKIKEEAKKEEKKEEAK